MLQPNSPRSIVVSALGSPKQTRQLARRIFYSFCPSNRTELIVDDIVSCCEYNLYV